MSGARARRLAVEIDRAYADAGSVGARPSLECVVDILRGTAPALTVSRQFRRYFLARVHA